MVEKEVNNEINLYPYFARLNTFLGLNDVFKKLIVAIVFFILVITLGTLLDNLSNYSTLLSIIVLYIAPIIISIKYKWFRLVFVFIVALYFLSDFVVNDWIFKQGW